LIGRQPGDAERGAQREAARRKAKIGFAFLDCSIVSSYKLVFDFLLDVIGHGKMYVYIDVPLGGASHDVPAACRPRRRGIWSDSNSRASGVILERMLSRPRSRPLSNFIEPCLPRPADKPPAGRDWIHEIKHDGFRIMTQRDAAGVRLLTRNGHDVAGRFPMAAAAVAALPARACLIDGEAIVCDANGLAVFNLIRGQRPAAAVLCAFDLLELDGEDLRREPIETRKSTLKSLLRGKHEGIAFNAHFIADGAIVYRQACALGCEGIVSKRLGSPYRSGRADCWLKVKNPAAPAVTREAEEEWN
jgi:bifunctional non-homologous end joining protein LigD